jgi:zinc D-Ala-D-Ala carboxypeptidase
VSRGWWVLGAVALGVGVAAVALAGEDLPEPHNEPEGSPEEGTMPTARGALPERPGQFFKWSEVEKSSTAVKLSIPNKPTDDAAWAAVDLTLAVLDPLRKHLGVPVRPTSWYRSPALNKAIGGARNSDHMRGRAVDIVADGYTAVQLARIVRSLGLPVDQGIGYGDAPHLHLSHRPGSNRGEWLWYPTHQSKSQPWTSALVA